MPGTSCSGPTEASGTASQLKDMNTAWNRCLFRLAVVELKYFRLQLAATITFEDIFKKRQLRWEQPPNTLLRASKYNNKYLPLSPGSYAMCLRTVSMNSSSVFISRLGKSILGY